MIRCDTSDNQNIYFFNFQKRCFACAPVFRHLENSNLSSTTHVDLKKRPHKGLDRYKIDRCYETDYFFHSMNINYCETSMI